jgi:hypothetical protein
MSMIPGVTNFPCPSITTARGGSGTLAPTATILPSCIRIEASAYSLSVPVRMVAPRMMVGRDGSGL